MTSGEHPTQKIILRHQLKERSNQQSHLFLQASTKQESERQYINFEKSALRYIKIENHKI